MSGGSFDYAYSRVLTFADDLADMLEQTYLSEFQPETLTKLREIAILSRKTALLMYAVEWLYSGDTTEQSFMERVRKVEEE